MDLETRTGGTYDIILEVEPSESQDGSQAIKSTTGENERCKNEGRGRTMTTEMKGRERTRG